jgi:hypothetical protein
VGEILIARSETIGVKGRAVIVFLELRILRVHVALE